MNTTEIMEQRISTLEIHISHQENTIQELSDSLTEHWKSMDSLTRKLEMVTERLLNLEHDLKIASHGEPPPPHF